jgi:Tfp pilus assembly protein PilF
MGSQGPKRDGPPATSSRPALSAQQVFKRVSPSVMVVESLNAAGKLADFGSGVVIAAGRVITNRHVVAGGASFRVVHGGKGWPAKLLKTDPDHDLAELFVSGLRAPAVTVLDSSKLVVGEKVYAIGAPEGLELTISEGLISGLRDFGGARVIQTSAAISPGSSGGGLFDSQGRLVGITTFYLKGGQSLNFALPAEWTLALNRQPTTPAPAVGESSSAAAAAQWMLLGIGAIAKADYKSAARDFSQFVRLKPDDEFAWVELGFAYVELGQYDKAVSAYQEALRLKPDDEAAWVNLGFAYGHLGQYDMEVSVEQEALRLKPDDAAAWFDLGLAYKGEGDESEVIKVYEKLKTLNPALADKFFKLAVVP